MHEQRNALRGARQSPRSGRKRADSLRWNRQERSSVQLGPRRFRRHPAEPRIPRPSPPPHNVHRAGNGLFRIWYLTYVVLAAYATDFMAQRVYGEINVGLLMGIGQFATTLLLTSLYARYARKRLDPQVDELRANASGAV